MNFENDSSGPIIPNIEENELVGEDQAALAVIIGAFAHGLRPDLDPGYLFEYSLRMVQELTSGDGFSNVEAEQLGLMVSEGARLPGKDDTRH